MAYSISALLNSSYATNDTSLHEKAEQWMKKSRMVGFQKNEGQFTVNDQQENSYILFKASAPNLNIWVTTTGLTYQFYTSDKPVINSSLRKSNSRSNYQTERMKQEWHRIDMVLKNATLRKENVITEEEINTGITNYYLAHCPDGILNVKTYGKVTIKNIYNGIDWVLYSRDGKMEYDFIVHPNADPAQIKLIYEGSGNFSIENNSIQFKNKLGDIAEGQLYCYQGNHKNVIPSAYKKLTNNHPVYAGAGNGGSPSLASITNSQIFSHEVSVKLESYDKNQTLIIDPELVWGTYFGGPDPEIPKSITCDRLSNVYITGIIADLGSGLQFPVQNWTGAYNQTTYGGNMSDAFIMRFNNNGILTWATYYGGNDSETGNSVVCDANSNVYVTGLMVMDPGVTVSTLPLQNLPGAFNQPNAIANELNAFLLRFNINNGTCTWGTFCAAGEPRALTCDAANNLYITGGGYASPAQTWSGAYNDASFAGGFDIFVLRFNSAGVLTWATNYGGPDYEEGIDICTDRNGNIYITGSAHDSINTQPWINAYFQQTFTGGYGDGFILRFTNTGALTWATYYPGTEQCTNIECDGLDNVYVTGYSSDIDDGPLHTQNLPGAYNQPVYGGGGYDACIMKFNSTGNLTWATYFGGADQELIGNFSNGAELAIDKCNNIYTSMTTIDPSTVYSYAGCSQYFYPNPIMPFLRSQIMKFNKNGKVLWSTPYGATGNASGWGFQMTLDNTDNLFISKAVYEPSQIWPVVNPGGSSFFDTIPDTNEDLYIAKFIPDPAPLYSQSQTFNSATLSFICGDPPFDYVWSNGTQTINSDSSSNTITGLTTGNISVTATSNCNHVIIANFNISGINENSLAANQLSIYPNPSSEKITIMYSQALGNSRIKILDIKGRIIKEIISNNLNSIDMDIASLTNGIYILEISDLENIYRSKFIKN